uniref:Mex-3 RNA binding family member C n=1 Tax=Lepisosteus oculatus TaxID=7918 RepID=W5N5E4_LEPOC|nr:PREDICTED: RNA-binding E3 ubiquitin-protein ligase MEX3C [Lepisosteus oculatus]
MPSSTSLLVTEETESELPPLVVERFADVGLDDHGPQSRSEPQEAPLHPAASFGLLGAVLDLQPLSRHQPAEEEEEEEGEEEEEEVLDESDSSALLSQAQVAGLGSVMLPGLEAPETVMLYGGELEDPQPHAVPGMMMILPPGYGEAGFEAEPPSSLLRRRSVNTTECVEVPSSEHVAEIVGRQGCKIKALRAKTNTYIKTPVRGEQPVFVVTGRKEDVAMAKREILSAAEHFSLIRASRNKAGPLSGGLPGAPNLPGQTTIQVRVPYRVVGLVVGPKGATIKRIQQQTHTYIVTPSRDKEPVFEVTGMPENVDRAREEIEAHIALRTGSYVEMTGEENDFHYNGTDVSFDGGCSSWLHSNPAPPGGGARGTRITSNYRNDSSSSLGSGSTDSYYGGGGGGRMADFSPTSPFNGGGGSFWFGEALLPLGSEDLGGMESPGFDPVVMTPQQVIWSPFEQGTALFDGRSQRRESQPSTPRLSPTFPDSLEHPLARRVQSDPLSTQSSKCQMYLPAFSSSSDSTTSSSPPDSASSAGLYRGRQDCIKCMESEVIAALVPCGHNLFCMECANSICEKSKPVCPVCQVPVTQAIRLLNM